MVQAVPVLDDIGFEALLADPYPSFDRIRDLGSAVMVPCANLILVTRFDDVVTVEQNAATFSSSNPGSLMHRFMGHTLMRKDFDAHAAERKAIAPSFGPGAAKGHWAPIFREIAAELIDGIRADGQADLFNAFAAPMASIALARMIGFRDVAWQDLAAWSQALMDGVANYDDKPEVTQRGLAASAAIDAAIDAVIDIHRSAQSPCILSSMLRSDPPQSLAQVRANIKVIIGGGLNEPRDAILTTLFGLLAHPDQGAAAAAEPALFAKAFDEAIRWVAPIGMYPRRVAEAAILGDTALPEGVQIGICVGAANRDAGHFDDPHGFDLFRENARHLAFGRGPHFCAGAWVSRQMVGEVALPMLFERLRGLRLDPDRAAVLRGWVFRGPVTLPVRWDAGIGG